ncbi:MAG: hypothetical protein GQ538_01200 [Xanthomonadales bacterium]|nr:hypothetical protein [Xanthomonadales bacterium]
MKRLLTFLLLVVSSATLAESGAYRVEVIVFRNLDVISDPVLEDELRSFSHYPALDQILVDDAVLEIPNKHLPEDLNVVLRRSSRMDGVWRRLRSSQGYRPLLYKSWVQNRVDFYPPMRVHNERVIDSQLRPPTNIVVADLAAEDPLAAYRSIFYQLDGSVQLRRSRFLHLFLDLEYRDENTGETVENNFFESPEESLEVASFNQQHGIFKLKENRQIRTGRLQYFDTPYFGALVLVNAIAAP